MIDTEMDKLLLSIQEKLIDTRLVLANPGELLISDYARIKARSQLIGVLKRVEQVLEDIQTDLIVEPTGGEW